MSTLLLSEINVGKRVRKDMGNIKELADSIADIGLLHPVVVRPNGNLIAGARRLQAVKLLGWEEIPVTITKKLKVVERALKAEREENTCRKELTPSELVSKVEQVLEEEKIAAKERQRLSRGQGIKGIASCATLTGKAVDRAVKAVGTNSTKFRKAKKVVDAAKSNPDKFTSVKKRMDETGNVDSAYREVTGQTSNNGKAEKPLPRLAVGLALAVKVQLEKDDEDVDLKIVREKFKELFDFIWKNNK